MKKILLFLPFLLSFIFISCINGQSKGNEKQNLIPKEFIALYQKTENAKLIDVRTSGEFAEGFIEGAINMDYNNGDFLSMSSKLEKNTPIFIYCLSGGRSGSAASELRDSGFEKVYELDGGIMKWNAEGMPLVTKNSVSKSKGMSEREFNKLLDTDKIVLIDYFAEWCHPCQKLKPILEEIGVEYKNEVNVIRIDIDKNPEIAKLLGIESIPVLQVYKNKKMTWSHLGFIEKNEIVKQLK